MMWGNGYGFGGGLIMILFWAIIIALIVLAARWLMTARGGGAARDRDALERLRDRFAAGEIDEEEFERRRKVLER